jgi:hypothetical protein
LVLKKKKKKMMMDNLNISFSAQLSYIIKIKYLCSGAEGRGQPGAGPTKK